MSSNNRILIKKLKNKFVVKHQDIDTGRTMDNLGEFETLEEAVKRANEFEKEYNAEGIGIEYGIKIIL